MDVFGTTRQECRVPVELRVLTTGARHSCLAAKNLYRLNDQVSFAVPRIRRNDAIVGLLDLKRIGEGDGLYNGTKRVVSIRALPKNL